MRDLLSLTPGVMYINSFLRFQTKITGVMVRTYHQSTQDIR